MGMMDERFRKVEDQYFLLRGKLDAGRLTGEQFADALKKLMLQDAQGRYWTIGADSGKWYVHDGQSWSPWNPPEPDGVRGVCASCGQVLGSSAAFCSNCGQQVTSPGEADTRVEKTMPPGMAPPAPTSSTQTTTPSDAAPPLTMESSAVPPAGAPAAQQTLYGIPAPVPAKSPPATSGNRGLLIVLSMAALLCCTGVAGAAVLLPQSPLNGLIGAAGLLPGLPMFPTNTPTPATPLSSPSAVAPTALPALTSSGEPRDACKMAVGSQIYDKWVQMGGQTGILGCPRGDESEAVRSPQGTTGRIVEFDVANGGIIVWHRSGKLAGQAFEVHGRIVQLYLQVGGTGSVFGIPHQRRGGRAGRPAEQL